LSSHFKFSSVEFSLLTLAYHTSERFGEKTGYDSVGWVTV